MKPTPTHGFLDALSAAREEAAKCGLDVAAPEHLLLGILRARESSVVDALQSMGLGVAPIRHRLEGRLDRGDAADGVEITFSDETKLIIGDAFDLAQRFNHESIGTHHLLLGIVRHGNNLAARILKELELDVESFRKATVRDAGQVKEELNYKEIFELRRIRTWAKLGKGLASPNYSLSDGVVQLRRLLSEAEGARSRDILLGLCLELNEKRSLVDGENWRMLRLTLDQAKAILDIGDELQTLLTSE